MIMLFIVILIFPATVAAYIDPGTGSYLLQLLMAGLFGGIYAIKMYWHSIKNFFVGKKNK